MQTALRAIAVTVQTMDAQCNPRTGVSLWANVTESRAGSSS